MRNSVTKTAVFVAMALVATLVVVSIVWPTSAAQYGTNPQSSYWYQLPWLGVICSWPRFEATFGPRIESVIPDSPAAAAGLQRGDYIVAIQKGFDFFLPHELASYCLAGDVVLVICKRKTGAEEWWNFTTFGHYVRLAPRPDRPLKEGEV